jgi:hypothetical protein
MSDFMHPGGAVCHGCSKSRELFNVKTFLIAVATVCLGIATPCLARNATPEYLGAWALTKTTAAITGVHPVWQSGSWGLAADVVYPLVEAAFAIVEAPDGNVGVGVTGVLVKGQAYEVRYFWKGKFDGQDYPVRGDAYSDTWSYERVDEHTLRLTAKKDGRVVRNATFVFHGKKCTLTTGGTTTWYQKVGADGK